MITDNFDYYSVPSFKAKCLWLLINWFIDNTTGALMTQRSYTDDVITILFTVYLWLFQAAVNANICKFIIMPAFIPSMQFYVQAINIVIQICDFIDLLLM